MRQALLIGWLGAALLAAASPSRAEVSEPNPDYLLIQRAFLREDFIQVAAKGPAFLAQSPDSGESRRVWIWTALSLDRIQRTNDAIQTLDQLKRRLAPGDPLWSELLFWEGDISRRAMQVVRAKIAYQRLLERDPRTTWAPQAKMGLGLIYLQQQAYPSALRYFQDVAQHHADTPAALDALLLQGVCHVRLRAYEDAVRVLRPLTERLKSPDAAAQAAVYLGESLSGLGRHEEAIAVYQRALAEAASTSSWGRLALFGLGWAQFHEGHCADSLETFERYLARPGGEHRIEALFAQGSCLLQTDREGEALQRFQHIVSTQPAHPLAFDSGLAIVDIRLREEDFAQAKAAVHDLLRRPLEPDDRAQLQLRLGSVALGVGNVAQARTVFELATHGEDPTVRQPAFSGLGDVQSALGDLAAAAQAYDRAREPASTAVGEYAAFQRARLHLQVGEYSEAVAIFQRLIANAHARVSQDASIALALAYLQQGETDIARRQLEAIRRQREGSAAAVRAGYYLALILAEDGQGDAARELCEQVLEKARQSDEAVDARLLLAELMLRERPASDVIVWLRRAYHAPGLPARHRGKLAKRLGDFAREQAAYGDALRWYDEAERWWPAARGEVRYRAASCLEEAGDLEAAMQRYRTVDQPPWQVRGQLALAKLLERQGRLPEATVIYESLADQPIAEAKVVKERLAALRGQSRDEGWE